MAIPSPADPDISVLNQVISDEEGTYRLQYAASKVGYVNITTDVFDDDTMCRPYLLIPQIRDLLPTENWTRLSIRRDSQGALHASSSSDPLPTVERLFHPRRVDVTTLEETERYRSGVHEVVFEGRPAIAKIAEFEWMDPRMERETWAYSVLEKYYQEHPDELRVSPKVLAHLTEGGPEGRVIGLLLEKLEGRFASLEDLLSCEEVLRRLHAIGLGHGDVNRYNFIVAEDVGSGGKLVKMVDFEYATSVDLLEEAELRQEFASLSEELSEDTGRGGPGIVYADDV